IDRLDGVLQGIRDWKSYDSDPLAIASLQALGTRARSAVSKLAEEAASLAALREKIRTLLYEANDMLGPEAPIGRAVVQFQKAFADLRASQAQFESLTGSALDNLLPSDADALGSTSALCQRIIEHHVALRDWCAWVRRRSEAMDLLLGPLVHAIESGLVQPDEV